MSKDKNIEPFSTSLKILYYNFVFSHGRPKSKLVNAIGWSFRIVSFLNLCVLPLHHLITSIGDGIEVDISEDISSIVGGCMAVILLCLFKFKEPEWSRLIEDVVDFRKFKEHPEFHTFSKKMNFISGAIYSCYIASLLLYAAVVYNSRGRCKEINEEKGLHEFCGSITSIRLPFEDNSLFIRLPIFLTQMLVNGNALLSAAHITFLVYEITQYLVIHIDLLKRNMLEVFDAENVQDVSNKFKFCVTYHNHILKLCTRFNHVTIFTVGELSLTAAIIFACIGNQILKGTSMAGMAYFQGYVTELFFLCHSGQMIMDKTESVGSAIYQSKWYEAEAKLMRDIVPVLRRCQIPMKLQALPQGNLSYALFLMMMNSAYTYFTLLAQTT